MLCGWYAVGLIPEGVGFVAFSLVPVGLSQRFFFTIASAARSLCT